MTELNDTNPVPVTKSSRKTTLWVVLGGIALILLGLLLGVAVGIYQRNVALQNQIKQSLGEQYSLGVQEMTDGNYVLARQRFEWILGKDPNYPGAKDKLTEVLVMLSATSTVVPSDTPTPDISPTPDLRGVEELFTQAQQKLASSDWDGAQQTLDSLRQKNPDYKTIQVDGMYYILLRNRGMDKILVQHNLEGGIYDLTLAEHFGPLDNSAAGLRNFSRLYLTGASLWDVDWAQVVNYFQQLAASLPNLTDSSGYSASQRYYLALIEYGKLLMSKDKPCDAQVQFDLAWAISPADKFRSIRNDATNQCNASKPPTPTITLPTPTSENTPDPPTSPPPTETPTETPTP